MKKIIILLISLLYTLTSFSKQIDYPIIHVDSNGIAVITMTIEQAQILDNKIALLEVLEKTNVKLYDLDSLCIRVINDKELVIIEQDIQISNLKILVDNKSDQIENLQKRIIDYKLKSELYSKEIINKDKEINLHLGEIDRLKNRMLFGGIGSGIIMVILSTILIIR